MLGFFLIFIMIIIACGNAIFVLNANRNHANDGDELYEQTFTEGYGFISAVLNQFIVSIGQGNLDNYSKDENTNNRDIAWVLFFLVSVFTQIIILNMLIALMGDTFDKVIENKQLATLKLKVKVVSDFIFLLPNEGEKFIFLATPRIKEGDQS